MSSDEENLAYSSLVGAPNRRLSDPPDAAKSTSTRIGRNDAFLCVFRIGKANNSLMIGDERF